MQTQIKLLVDQDRTESVDNAILTRQQAIFTLRSPEVHFNPLWHGTYQAAYTVL